MGVSVKLEVPQGDIDRLGAQMDRAITELGITTKESMTMAANRVALSLGKSTAIAPKYRELNETGKVSGNRKFSDKTGRFYFNREFRVLSLKGGARKSFYIWAKNKREAKRDRRVKIGRRGLAKMTWRRAARDIGADAGLPAGGATNSANIAAERHGSGRADFSALNPFFELTSGLTYASKAMIGETVGTIVSRSADAMAHIIENRLAKKFAEI